MAMATAHLGTPQSLSYRSCVVLKCISRTVRERKQTLHSTHLGVILYFSKAVSGMKLIRLTQWLLIVYDGYSKWPFCPSVVCAIDCMAITLHFITMARQRCPLVLFHRPSQGWRSTSYSIGWLYFISKWWFSAFWWIGVGFSREAAADVSYVSSSRGSIDPKRTRISRVHKQTKQDSRYSPQQY